MPRNRSIQRTISTRDKVHRGLSQSRCQSPRRKPRKNSKKRHLYRNSRAARHTSPLFKRNLKQIVKKVFGDLLHHKQVNSLFMIAVGVVHSALLGVAAVGTSMARTFGKKPKHGIKQVDRFLSNKKLEMLALFECLIPFVVGSRRQILVAMDWTEFDADDHSTISLALITRAKRTIPLIWLTVKKSELEGNQKWYERLALMSLYAALPKGFQVIIVADRGFGDVRQYAFIKETLGFDFVIRYRQRIYVLHKQRLQASSTLVPGRGQVRVIRDTVLTGQRVGLYNVVLVKASGMKDAWCLATSLSVNRGKEIAKIYGRRFQCEETFRDLKDRRYGYGLRFTKIRDAGRRDRFILVFTLAYIAQVLMGVASEHLGLDKTIRANTETRRTHSLFRQGRSLLGNVESSTYAALGTLLIELFNQLFSEGILEVIS